MQRLIFLFLATILITQNLFAQPNKKALKTTNNINVIYNKVGVYTDSLFQHTNRLNNCLSGVMFIRFNVNKKGRIINIETNEGTPGLLDTVFREALQSHRLRNQVAEINKKYLLPVLYNLNYHCKIDTVSKKMGPLERLLEKIPDNNTPNKDGYIYSFLNMVNFKKTKDIALNKVHIPEEYILLSPFELTTPFHEQWIK